VRTRVAFNHGEKSAKGEFGWDGAAGADMTMDPEHRLSVMFMTHIRNWPSMLGPVHLQLRDVLYPILGV
jgi:CubicO group peptidase (beta-lactamase class C family)